MTDASDLARHMEGVARALLGDPNKAMSSKGELRFGSNGSLSIDLKKSTAFDHEAGEGGGVLWLIHRQTGLANGAAFDWLREHGFDVEDRREQQPEPRRQQQGERRDVEATYDYVGETGDLLYQVVRWVFTDADGRPVMTKDGQKRKKTFTQRRPSGEQGIRSALGSRPPEVHYIWASLWQISDKERAEIGVASANTIKTLVDTGLFPQEALAVAGANMLVERSIMPGLEQAIDDAGGLPDYEALLKAEQEAARLQAQQGQQPPVQDAAP